MLEEKAGQEEAVQAASAKLLALEEFNEQLGGKVGSKLVLQSTCSKPFAHFLHGQDARGLPCL